MNYIQILHLDLEAHHSSYVNISTELGCTLNISYTEYLPKNYALI